MLKNQKGITLIALIITIIVMLILVGVTITVALNGGLFSKAKKATYQTEASTVKEQLEIAKAVEIANNGGNALSDYSIITVEKLDGLDANTKNEYGHKILVNKAGDVCYNPETVTDEEERNWLEEIGINEYVEINTGDSYTFTLADLVDRGLLGASGEVQVSIDEFFPDYVSEELKNSRYKEYIGSNGIETYNISCSDSKYLNTFETQNGSLGPNGYAMYVGEGMIIFAVTDENEEFINNTNYTDYPDLRFTISMPE